MTTASPRLRALLAGGAALLALGVIAPVHAEPGKSNGNGANQDCGVYCPTDVGAPSGNGNGNGQANGKPGAGTVGNADSKYPPGQAPGPSDNNNGYECDDNNGVGKTNPAHSGCDLPAYPPSDDHGGHGPKEPVSG